MRTNLFLLFFTCSFFNLTAQNVGIGTNTPAGKLHVKGSANIAQLIIDANSTQSPSNPLIRFRNSSGSTLMNIHTDAITNVFMGYNAGNINNYNIGTWGDFNTFIGSYAGAFNTTGRFNTVLGSGTFLFNSTGFSNTALGVNALYNNTQGDNNISIGVSALEQNKTAGKNVAIGNSALQSQSFSNSNTPWDANNVAIGFASLTSNQPTSTGNGINNTAVGTNSLFSNTTGFSNVAIGIDALKLNTIKNNLVAIGDSALLNNATGTANTAIGSKTLFLNTDGYQNTATGFQSLYTNTSNDNSGFGYKALYSNSTGFSNTANGAFALGNNVSGNSNTAIGDNALVNNTTGNDNTAVGREAMFLNTTGFSNVAIGIHALRSNSIQSNLVAIGDSSLFNNITGKNNVAVGSKALFSNNSGERNTAMGYHSLYSNSDGLDNTSVGYRSLFYNTSTYNTAIGSLAMEFNHSGYTNVAVGVSSLRSNYDGTFNTAVGAFSLSNNTAGHGHTAIGYGATVINGLFNSTAIGIGAQSDCSNCVVLGSVAGVNNAIYDVNVGIGQNNPGFPLNFKSSLGDKISFWGNSGAHYGIGVQSLLFQIHSDVVGSDIAFGYGSSTSFTETMRIKGNGNAGIGTTAPQQNLSVNGAMNIDQANTNNGTVNPGISFGSASGESIASKRTAGGNQYGMDFYTNSSNRMSITNAGFVGIGTSNPGFLFEVNGVAAKPGGGVWAASSDARLKESVSPYTDGLASLLKINPVKFHYNSLSGYDTKPEYVGVIAQELERIAPYMINTFKKNNETYLNVDNSAMIYMLINAVKEQQKQIEELKSENAVIKNRLNQKN